MPIQDAIVSYTNLIQPFKSQDALLAKTHEAATRAIVDPAKVAATMDDFKAGLDLWRAEEIHPQIMHTPRHPNMARLQSHIVEKASLGNQIEQFLMKIAGKIFEGLEVKFSAEDWPEWAASFFTWIADIVPAVPLPPDPVAAPIPNNFAVGVLGDFGTGRYGGPQCGQFIASSPDSYDLMFHLGDVYYSATPPEVEDRFFKYWPGQKAPLNRTLNGNHEMYTGGHTYFGTMLPRFHQSSSYFAMQNDNWALIGLDTAYHQAFGGQEGVLDDPQMEWLTGIVKAAGDRRIVLFSHHEPLTQLDTNKGGNLISQLSKYGLADRIFAWYWGHEHRCLLHDRHPVNGFYGRCVGHAAFPEGRPNLGNAPQHPHFGSQWRRLPQKTAKNDCGDDVIVPAAWIYDTNNLWVPDDYKAQFAPNGFMRLEFSGSRLTELVRAPDNATVWVEELTVSA